MFAKMKKLVIVFLIFLFAAPIFAVEEYVAEIYKEIDHIFIIKSEDELNTVLSENNKDRYYYLIENYTEKKIRRLIVNNDYDFAMAAIVIVIENNLDNEQAVEMYSVISEAYEVQKEHELEEEQKRLIELARIELEKEKQRKSVDKEYVSAETGKGSSVYISGKETKLTSSSWKGALGLADILYLHAPINDIDTFHYGISLDYRYEYTLANKLVIGADLFGGFQFLSIADEDKMVPLIGELEIAPKTSFGPLKNIFARVGFASLITGKTSTASLTTEAVSDTILSPLVGVKIERIPLGSLKLDIGADWYAGHLFYKDINFAMGAAMNVEIPFAELEKVKLSFNIGARDKIILREAGLENRASIILAIGVENVIR